jgi:hypothetical protein
VIGAFALRTAMKDLEHLARTEAADGWPDALRRASGLLRETHAAFGAALNGVLPDERL